jgi:hypothetical protein
MSLEPNMDPAKWIEHIERFVDGGSVDTQLLALFTTLRDYLGDDAEACRERGKLSTQIFDLVQKQGELFLREGQEEQAASDRQEQAASDRLWFAENLFKFYPKDGTEAQTNRHTKKKIVKPPSLCNAVARYINSNRYWQKRQGWDAAMKRKEWEIPLDIAEQWLPSNVEPKRSLHELLEHELACRQLQARSVNGTNPTLYYDLFLAELLDETLPENLTKRIDCIAQKYGVKKAKLSSHCYREFYPFLKDLYNKGL